MGKFSVGVHDTYPQTKNNIIFTTAKRFSDLRCHIITIMQPSLHTACHYSCNQIPSFSKELHNNVLIFHYFFSNLFLIRN